MISFLMHAYTGVWELDFPPQLNAPGRGAVTARGANPSILEELLLRVAQTPAYPDRQTTRTQAAQNALSCYCARRNPASDATPAQGGCYCDGVAQLTRTARRDYYILDFSGRRCIFLVVGIMWRAKICTLCEGPFLS